jgi:hypothetical protein
MIVSLLSYGVFCLGVVLGGLALLVIFSLLALAQKGDQYQEQLELALRQRQDLPSSLVYPEKSENLGSPADSGPGQVGVFHPGMLISR